VRPCQCGGAWQRGGACAAVSMWRSVKEKGCATVATWRSMAERGGEAFSTKEEWRAAVAMWQSVAERGGAWRGSLPHEGARPRRGGVKGSVVLHLDGIMKKTFAERKRVLYGAIFPQK
jgi:hypothetical protein